MTDALKLFRRGRIDEITSIILSDGHYDLKRQKHFIPIWNDKDYCGVYTYGEKCGNSLNNIAEMDAIVSVEVKQKPHIDWVRTYVRTLDNTTYDIEDLPADDIDELFELITSFKNGEGNVKECYDWYVNFMSENN